MIAAIGMYLARKMLGGAWVSAGRVHGNVAELIGRCVHILRELHRGAARPRRNVAVRATGRARFRDCLRVQEVCEQEVPPREPVCEGLGAEQRGFGMVQRWVAIRQATCRD
jgi:hypothetical protein